MDTTQRSIDPPSQFFAGYSPEMIIKRVESIVIKDGGFSVGGGRDKMVFELARISRVRHSGFRRQRH